MPGRLVRVCWFVIASAMFGVVSVPGLGMRPAHAAKEDARKHYERATAAFGLGRYGDAAVEYESAFRMRPDPALLYNCAQSYRLAGNKARALELYRNYVRLYGDAPNADDARKHAENLRLEIAAEKALVVRPPPASGPASTPTPTPNPTPMPSGSPIASPLSPPPVVGPSVLAPAAPVPPPAAAAAPSAPHYSSPSTSSPSSPVPSLSVPPSVPPGAAPPVTAGPEVHVDAAPPPASAGAADGEQRSLITRPWFWVAVGAVVVGGTVAIILASGGEQDPKATLGVVTAN